MDKIIRQLNQIVGNECVLNNEPLSNHTSFRIGGACTALIMPKTINELTEVVRALKSADCRYFVIGNGSNLLVADKGIDGYVIKTERLVNCTVNAEEIEAEAGILLSTLSNEAYKSGLAGLEFASGIPGTLGGAIYMNAGAYDGEMSRVVSKTTYLSRSGDIVTIDGIEHCFDYRKSIFQDNQDNIILKSALRLTRGNKENIKYLMNDLNSRRREKQPLEWPSAGSTFRRPQGHFAGKLITEAGLSGKRIGGAMVSEKHCGFIINAGGATAKDVIDLIALVKYEVSARFNVILDAEIKILGEHS